MKPLLGFKEHLLLIFMALYSDKTDRASGQEKFIRFSFPDQNRENYLYLKEDKGATKPEEAQTAAGPDQGSIAPGEKTHQQQTQA